MKRKDHDIYVRVDYKGNVSRASRCNVQEMHEANFIVVNKDGGFVVLKDRYGIPDRVLTKAEADARALDHIDVAQGKKSPKDIYIF